MGSIRFGKGAEEKPVVITSEVKELRAKVEELMVTIKSAETSSQNDVLRTVALAEKDRKLDEELRYQRNLIKVCTGIIIIIQIISLFGV